MPHHRPQPVIPYHLIHGNNAKVDHAHARVDLKETRINTLETDKALKDTKIAALETDKSEKDTKMSTIESDMTALTNRVTALETLGIKGISNAVNWTNLTEINLSGEKLVNGDFSSVTNNAPTNWVVKSGTLNQSKLSQGIIKGAGGTAAIQQSLSQNIESGTDLIIKIESNDDIKVFPIKSNGQTDNNNSVTVSGSVGYVEYTTVTAVSGFKISTMNSLREFSSISIFQGAISGGTVQAYAGGGLEKISGTGGWNAGASSVQKIEGNSDGYVQFQWNSKSVRIGLKYSNTDYDVDSPYLNISASANTANGKSISPGDWFRIRHYAVTNEIHYQRKEKLYVDDPDFCTVQSCGLMPSGGHSTNHTFATDERPLVIAKVNSNGLTKGEYYRLHQVNTSNGSGRIYTLGGAVVNWVPTRGTNWEIQKEAGQDYVTFYTEPTLTNGNDLYVDVSFWAVGARINDVTIVT